MNIIETDKVVCNAGMNVIEADDLEICTVCGQDFFGVMKILKDSPKDNHQIMVNASQ